MSLSALGLVQEFAAFRGLPVPTALVGSVEKSNAQYRAILNAVVRKLLGYSWETQKAQSSFTSVAAASQGNLATLLAPAGGFESIVQGSMWNTSRKIPVMGPITDQAWAVQSALNLAGPPFKCWVAAGILYLSPIPAAGETFQAIYQTSYGFASSGGTPQLTLQSDSDIFLFPDDVMIKGFEAYWQRQKGEESAPAVGEFMDLIIRQKVARGMPTLSMEAAPDNTGPRIYIPIGDWPV